MATKVRKMAKKVQKWPKKFKNGRKIRKNGQKTLIMSKIGKISPTIRIKIAQKSTFWSKIDILVKNLNFAQKSNF